MKRWLELRMRRRAFIVYAVLLFIATHYPKLRLPGPEIRSDLIIHFVAFGLWAFFFASAACIGPWQSRRNLLWTLPIGWAYAAFDEGLQAIPALGRTCAWDDFAANCIGITIGVAAAAFASRKLQSQATK